MQIEWSLKIKKNIVFLKNNWGWCNKDKRLTERQVLIKEFTKRVFKKMKVTQLFKPTDYWEIAANICSN